MKVAGGQTEDGIVIGNTFDKYGSQNPVVRWIMQGFDRALSETVGRIKPRTIHELGCGEGFWVMQWISQGIDARGTDFSRQVIEMARANARASQVDENRFCVRSIYDITAESDSADLIVCCEVMEHLQQPEQAMIALQRVVTSDLIISVPREPLWRGLNLARGKYVSDFGNTPGHLQHWSRRGITSLTERYFDVVDVISPLPWTMIHCRRKS
jgi:2-polyprenyl-3-methyl-5-hydroxy-6-metoxy-1,4-benzoquinol methylase